MTKRILTILALASIALGGTGHADDPNTFGQLQDIQQSINALKLNSDSSDPSDDQMTVDPAFMQFFHQYVHDRDMSEREFPSESPQVPLQTYPEERFNNDQWVLLNDDYHARILRWHHRMWAASYSDAKRCYPSVADKSSPLSQACNAVADRLKAENPSNSMGEPTIDPDAPFIIAEKEAAKLGIAPVEPRHPGGKFPAKPAPATATVTTVAPASIPPTTVEQTKADQNKAVSDAVDASRQKTLLYFPQFGDTNSPLKAKANEIWNQLLEQKSPLTTSTDAFFICTSMAASQLGIKPAK